MYVCTYVCVCMYVCMYVCIHLATRDIRQVNFNLQFIYYKNTAYNLWVHNVHNVMKKPHKSRYMFTWDRYLTPITKMT